MLSASFRRTINVVHLALESISIIHIEVDLVEYGSGNPKSYLVENGTDFGCSGGQVGGDRLKD
jgi:hypothetical protein